MRAIDHALLSPMNIRRCVSLSITTLMTAGCSSLPIEQLSAPDAANRAEVVIYRVYAFNAGGVSLTVGTDGKAFASLNNSEYVAAFVSPGAHAFFVQARNADPTKVTIELKRGERACLKAEADPGNLGKVILPPLLMATGYGFTLAPAACPSDAELAKYKRVDVEYR
jgi:hypothetical protein